MALKSLRQKISTIAGGEVLGKTDVIEEPKEKAVKPRKIEPKKKVKKEVKNKKETKEKSGVFSFVKEPSEPVEETSELTQKNESENVEFVENSIDGYEDVLAILGIKEHIELDVDFKSDQLDYVEFTQTQPIGFDFDEVTDFISRVKYTIHKLETALEQRNRDIVKVASEVKKVEQKMIEINHKNEMERMTGSQIEKEELVEENMLLKAEIHELSRKLNSKDNNSQVVKDLKKQIEVLTSENDLLRLGMSEGGKANTKHNKDSNLKQNQLSKLPLIDDVEDNKDPFSDMLQDIGGLYDDEL